jgi:hypothetical protein
LAPLGKLYPSRPGKRVAQDWGFVRVRGSSRRKNRFSVAVAYPHSSGFLVAPSNGEGEGGNNVVEGFSEKESAGLT